MKIKVLAKNLDTTAGIQEYVEEKIGSLGRFISRFEEQGNVLIRVEVARATKHHKTGDIYYAEATMYLPGQELRAEAYAEKIRWAVDKMKETLKNEIVRYKEKIDTKKLK